MTYRDVFIARHGHREDFFSDGQVNSEWPKTAQRPHDPGLSHLGRRQATQLGERLKDRGITHVFCSPFLRTVQTAHLIAEQLIAPVLIEEGLCEWLKPSWFSRTPDWIPPTELAAEYPLIDPVYRSFVRRSYPELDLEHDVWPAVAQALRSLLSKYKSNLVLVGHGASILAAMRALNLSTLPRRVELAQIYHIRNDTFGWKWLNGTHLD